jgi:hypothetical protein
MFRVGARAVLGAWAFALALIGAPSLALADKIKNPIAIFSGLDKITGRIISFEVGIDETVEFGAFLVTPRVCYTRPITEPQNTTAFVEVDEITVAGETKRLFGGWIFASSPGLNGVEHPIYDVWLIGCKGGTVVIPESTEITPKSPPPASATPAPSTNAQPTQLVPTKPAKKN